MRAQQILLDATGVKCPIPALRLARVAREKGRGIYVLLADDPAADADIPALCRERGWRLLDVQAGRFTISIE